MTSALALIVAIFAVAFGVTAGWRKRPLHPCFWLPPIYAMYATWFTVSQWVHDGQPGPLSETVLALNLLGLVAAVLGIILGEAVCASWVAGRPVSRRQWDTVPGEDLAFACLTGGCLLSLVYVMSFGLSTKAEIVETVTTTNPFFTPLWVIFTFFATRQIVLLGYGRRASALPVAAGIIQCVMIWLVVGERNFLFGLGLVSLLVILQTKRLRGGWLLYMVSIVVLTTLMPVTQALKASASGGMGESADPFTGDFVAPGRNLTVLLERPLPLDGLEVARRELLSSFGSRMLGITPQSLSAWFHEYRYQVGLGGQTGWGFTLVGSGHMMAGSAGVALFLLLYGLGLGVLSTLSSRSLAWMTVYLVMVPLAAYTLRQELAVFTGGLLKQALIPQGIILFVAHVLRDVGTRAALPTENRRPITGKTGAAVS